MARQFCGVDGDQGALAVQVDGGGQVIVQADDQHRGAGDDRGDRARQVDGARHTGAAQQAAQDQV